MNTRSLLRVLPLVGAALVAFPAAGAGASSPPGLRIKQHADVKAEATGPRGAIVRYGAAKVTGAVRVTYSKRSGTRFPLGKTVVRITARSSSGAMARSKFSVRVVDTTPPAFRQPTDTSAEATSPAGAAVTYPPVSADDLVSATIPATCLPASGGMFALGATTVTCSVTDRAGNHATATFVVRVADTKPPVFTAKPDMSVVATSTAGATVTYTNPTVTDAATPAPTVYCTPPSGSLFPVGTTTVTCSARDAVGNTATTTFHVIVTMIPAIPGNYSGTTSQGKAITFSVSSTGRSMTSLSIAFTSECSGPLQTGSASYTYTIQSVSIGSDGTVSLTDQPRALATVHLKATFSTSTSSASGTFDASTWEGVMQCSSGSISWTATRTG